MSYRFPAHLGLAILAAACTTAAAAATPTASPGAIFRPVFATPQGPLDAGTAFFARLDACPKPVLVSALHLFGPDGGLARAMAPAELRHGVKHVTLTSLDPGAKGLSLDIASITPPSANPCCSAPLHDAGDIVAFTSLAPPAVAMPVATEGPRIGQAVTLLAETADGPAAGWRHGAVVLGKRDGLVYYKFDEPNLGLQATSGAPVIDAAGNVVAIHLMGGHLARMDPKALIGGGNPAPAWRDAVEAGCVAR